MSENSTTIVNELSSLGQIKKHKNYGYYNWLNTYISPPQYQKIDLSNAEKLKNHIDFYGYQGVYSPVTGGSKKRRSNRRRTNRRRTNKKRSNRRRRR